MCIILIMKVNSITNNSFKALVEPNKKDYTSRQEKLASRVRDILNSTNKDDSKSRSYVDYYKEEFGLDLYIKPSKERKTIKVLSYDKSSDSFNCLTKYRNIIPKESDFLTFARYIKDDIEESFEKFLTFSVVALLVGLICLVNNKINPAQNAEKLKKMELVQNSNKLEKTADTLIKNVLD